MKRLVQITLATSALLLAACNLEGVASFSPNNDRVAVVTKNGSQYRLDTTDASGGNPIKIEDNIQPAFDVTPGAGSITAVGARPSDTASIGTGGLGSPIDFRSGDSCDGPDCSEGRAVDSVRSTPTQSSPLA